MGEGRRKSKEGDGNSDGYLYPASRITLSYLKRTQSCIFVFLNPSSNATTVFTG